jgi:hypothetical protein
MNETQKEYLTITLTDRPPVRITKDTWPVIASAKDWRGQYESQATRTWRITVRQHEDGRSIVYGAYTTQWQGETGRRGGELLEAGADLAAAIRRVGEDLALTDIVIERCIADLPAVDLE